MVRYIANFAHKIITRLDFYLKKTENALIFQITYQSPDITDFLASNTYRTKNGLLIAGGSYPEFKDSKNTIYLRGKDSSRDWKLDVTRFVGNMQRDNKYEMVKEALTEFVDFIKNSQSFSYTPPAPVVLEPACWFVRL